MKNSLKKARFILAVTVILLNACHRSDKSVGSVSLPPSGSAAGTPPFSWQQRLDEQLSFLGHRNWILVVDKAFPSLSARGIEVINTSERLLPVLEYTLDAIRASPHIKPVIFNDRELQYIAEGQARGVNAFRDSLQSLLNGRQSRTLMHDSVFTQMEQASKLFSVLVLKTEEIIPYSSVFIRLDCGYWNSKEEMILRKNMIK